MRKAVVLRRKAATSWSSVLPYWCAICARLSATADNLGRHRPASLRTSRHTAIAASAIIRRERSGLSASDRSQCPVRGGWWWLRRRRSTAGLGGFGRHDRRKRRFRLLPVALALARRRPSTVARVLTTVTLTSAWFGGYALTGWHYAI
jgi:hypothetical protein